MTLGLFPPVYTNSFSLQIYHNFSGSITNLIVHRLCIDLCIRNQIYAPFVCSALVWFLTQCILFDVCLLTDGEELDCVTWGNYGLYSNCIGPFYPILKTDCWELHRHHLHHCFSLFSIFYMINALLYNPI